MSTRTKSGSSPILVKNGLATTTLAESKICNKATDVRKCWIFNTSQTGTGSTKVAFQQNWRRTSMVLNIQYAHSNLSTLPAEDVSIGRFNSFYFRLCEHAEFFFPGSLG